MAKLLGTAIRVALLNLAVVGVVLAAGEPNFDAAKKRYGEIVAEELVRKITPGFSVAWVVDGRTVHAAGYGMADAERGRAANADTIYRAGSISKLFNAVAAMQLVERGQLDLDAPIQQALPEFHIIVPFDDAGPITARELLCHRSGMIREAPVGGYLDASQPMIVDTIASVADCALVNRPNTKTRYSNVGPTIVGRAIEVISGLPYAEYQRQHVIEPLGMKSSSWMMYDALRPRLAKGLMRIRRGRRYVFENAPQFELGTIPAGNLYTTATDLARFASFVMGAADESASAVLPRATLEKMFQPQLVDEPTGFGIGFHVNTYREHKTVQHSGAVYGFSTSIVVLPDEKIAVIVLANADIAAAPVRRLSEAALDLLLEAVRKEPLPEVPPPYDATGEPLADLAGDYESPSYWAKVEVADGKLRATLSGQPLELVPTGPLKFAANGRIMNRSPLEFERGADGLVNAFTAAGQTFTRTAVEPPWPTAWRRFVGSYGPSFIPLVVTIRRGHLYASVENEYDYRLTPVNQFVFNLPPGMYADEQVVFQVDEDGRVRGAVLGNQYLPEM